MRIINETWPRVGVLAAVIVGVLLAGCDNSNESAPVIVPESELEFVPVRSTAPPLETMDTSFWAVKGQDRELEIRFQGQGGPGTGSRFLEFKVDEQSLQQRPDGTMFQQGDSIEIHVTVDPELYLVDLEPSGLRFDPAEPAVLEIEYGEADEDFIIREGEFDAWRQEVASGPWELIGSVQIEELDEIEVSILGFTRFALAIGR